MPKETESVLRMRNNGDVMTHLSNSRYNLSVTYQRADGGGYVAKVERSRDQIALWVVRRSDQRVRGVRGTSNGYTPWYGELTDGHAPEGAYIDERTLRGAMISVLQLYVREEQERTHAADRAAEDQEIAAELAEELAAATAILSAKYASHDAALRDLAEREVQAKLAVAARDHLRDMLNFAGDAPWRKTA